MQSGKLEILRGDSALDLTDLANYALQGVDGFGMSPLHRITERGPLQHGESDLGYRLDPRLIQVTLNLRAASWSTFYARRQELLYYLSPASNAPVKLRFTQPDGAIRQIDGYIVDGPDFPKGDARRFQVQKAAFRMSCPDPAWYDPARQSLRIVAASGGSGFAFPMAVPWTFGGSSVDADVALDYDGTWLEYPEIVITGPIADARVENIETGDVLDFDGLTIADGDNIAIDLRYGYKTIVDQGGVNQIDKLTPDSDLATWHLVPGTNNIAFTGVSASTNTSIILRWYNRYLGV